MKHVVDELVQHEVVEPVFVVDYPEEVSPLARRHRTRPGYVERFELMVTGFELCNAYSEQNDAALQLAAFEDEARAKAGGDPEAGDVDEDYVRALEYGLPSTGGLGIGIDRLVMLLSGAQNIREVILFPTMRPPAGAPRPVDRSRTGGLGRLDAAPASGRDATAGPTRAAAPGPVLADAGVPTGPLTEAITVADAGRASRPSSRRPVLAVAWLTLLGGVIQLLPLLPFLHSRFDLDHVGPLWFRVTGHVVSTMLGLVLVLFAGQLARGRRRAWQVGLVLFAAGAVDNVLKGPHPIAAGYCVLMVVLLVALRGHFTARSDPPSLLRLIRLAPIAVAAVLVAGLGMLLLGSRFLLHPLTPLTALETVASGLVGIAGPATFTRPFLELSLRGTLLAFGIAGVLGAAYLLFRPLQTRRAHSDRTWGRAVALVHRYGSDTLASFALRADKSFFFGSDGQAFVAYTYLLGYALVSGDPIGAPGSVDRVLDEFLAARADDADRYEARGMRTFYLGDEAIIRCRRFDLEAPGMKSVRGAVRRVGRTHRFRVLRESEATPQLVAQLNAISEQWRGKAPERGFTMSLSQDVEGDGRAGVRRRLRVHPRPRATPAGRAERDDRVPHREHRRGARRRGDRPTVDELRDVGPAVLPRRPVHPRPADREAHRRRDQPVLPDPVAVRLQREVLPDLGLPGARLPGPDRPAAGGAAVRRRRGVPVDAGRRRAVRPARRRRGGRRARRARLTRRGLMVHTGRVG
jgi:lysyl-tRNA synthetase, class II